MMGATALSHTHLGSPGLGASVSRASSFEELQRMTGPAGDILESSYVMLHRSAPDLLAMGMLHSAMVTIGRSMDLAYTSLTILGGSHHLPTSQLMEGRLTRDEGGLARIHRHVGLDDVLRRGSITAIRPGDLYTPDDVRAAMDMADQTIALVARARPELVARLECVAAYLQPQQEPQTVMSSDFSPR